MVEHDLAKVGVAGSSPVSRSILLKISWVLFLWLAAPARAQGLALAPGDAAPRTDGGTVLGEPFSAAWGDGKLTVVNFWATWCAPCRYEMPELQKLWTERRKDGLRIVGIVAEEIPNATALSFLKETGVTYPVIFASRQSQRGWSGVTLLPATFLVGPDGRILRRYVGADAAIVAGMIADVAAVLEGKPMAAQVVPGPDSGQDSKP